jgi:hypothetical protein
MGLVTPYEYGTHKIKGTLELSKVFFLLVNLRAMLPFADTTGRR